MARYAKVMILGSGPAGYTAAIYAARANLQPLVIAGDVPGGQLTTTTEVENWPGAVPAVLGGALMEEFARHAETFGTEVVQDVITSVDFSRRPFALSGEFGAVYLADTVIICTGATARSIGLPSEAAFRGRGVSGCATCDGFFYKDMECCVIGGGNTAVEEALFLSNIASRVHLLHRRDRFRAEAALLDRLDAGVAAGRIVLRMSCELDEVQGDDSGVTAVRLRHAAGPPETLPVSGVFVAIGHDPNTTIFAGSLERRGGYLLTGQADSDYPMMTNVPGVFAAGDVQDSLYRQAVTSAGSGCMAALDARRFLEMTAGQRAAE